MTYPPFNPRVELFLAGAWVDITPDVRLANNALISITRGATDEAAQTGPTVVGMDLNNRAGKYSPRNPLGVYYGKIGRNTPICVKRDSDVRFTGEVSSWPGRWDITATDAWVPIEAAGILRRIGQGNQPASSGLGGFYRASSPVTYWPLDDGGDSVKGVPAAGSYRGSTFHREGPTVYTFAAGTLASYLAPTLRINDTNPAAGSDRVIGFCRGSDTTPDGVALDLVWKIDTEVVPAGTITAYPTGYFRVHLYLNGTNPTDWDLLLRHDGTNDDVVFQVTDSTGTTSLGNSAALTAITDTELHHLRILLDQNGADVDYTIYIDGVSVLSGTHNSYTLQTTDAASVEYDRNSNTLDGLLCLGHVIVWENLANIPNLATANGLAHGFLGETAGRRFERLCGELDIPFASNGDLDDTLAMGLQYEDGFSSQIAEIAATDRGLIYEPRATFALGYFTRTALYNQASVATLNFTALQLAPPFEPVEDDENIRNDIFAQNREAASYRATLETGPLSVLDPPNGVGRYKDEVAVNVETDDDLPPLAGWLLGIGTVDEARYPKITVDLLANPNPDLLDVDVGSVILITDTERLNIYDNITLLVLGYTEFLSPFEHRITFNCVPYSPYEVLELDGTESRLDPDGTLTLSTGINSTTPTLSVASSGALATTSAGDRPIPMMLGGEEISVTNITGGSSPQTFTATRSVNGVVKAHSSGAVLSLKRPGLLAL